MLEIGVLIYGIYTLVTGKFTLLGGKKLEGWRGRVTGAILLSYIAFAFLGGVVLALTGNENLLDNQLGVLGFSVVLLLITIVMAFTVGHLLYRGQEQEQVANAARNNPQFQAGNNLPPDNREDSPYRPPRY
jgi:hypothetical protein